MQAIILASSSTYRADLLNRLGLSVTAVTPGIDESERPGESAPETAARLARLKAERVTTGRSNAVVIGSDQVPFCNSSTSTGGSRRSSDRPPTRRLGKPGNIEKAREQLMFLSGRRVHFYTAVHLIDASSGRYFSACDDTVVAMRHLEADEIERYLQRESVLDCAGSFKAERLGISLFQSVDSVDPTALVGLPLISVCHGLRELGVAIP